MVRTTWRNGASMLFSTSQSAVIPGYDSWIRYLGTIPGYDAWIWFSDTILGYDSYIRLLDTILGCDCTGRIPCVPPGSWTREITSRAKILSPSFFFFSRDRWLCKIGIWPTILIPLPFVAITATFRLQTSFVPGLATQAVESYDETGGRRCFRFFPLSFESPLEPFKGNLCEHHWAASSFIVVCFCFYEPDQTTVFIFSGFARVVCEHHWTIICV